MHEPRLKITLNATAVFQKPGEKTETKPVIILQFVRGAKIQSSVHKKKRKKGSGRKHEVFFFLQVFK